MFACSVPANFGQTGNNWLPMKISLTQVFLTVSLCGAAVTTRSQTPPEVLDRKVSLNLTSVTFKNALTALETAARVKFVYSNSHLRLNEAVSVSADMKPLGQVLGELLPPLRVTYRLQENTEYIVLAVVDAAKDKNLVLNTLSGKVTDLRGTSLPGVSVLVRGTTTGTTTDLRGNFIVDLPDSTATLQFSFIGFATQEVTVHHQTMVRIALTEEPTALREVIITALGIARSEKSVSYTTQQISGEELNRIKTDNFMNVLSGKVAGVMIFPSASGVGGSSKVILRGNRSFAQSNQPLYIVDGIPITNSPNTNGQPNSPFSGAVDGGDGISNINPDDIESISILKGASAAALYGSQASNGAILITTRHGKEGTTQVNFCSSFMSSAVTYTPRLQNTYGRTGPASRESWGPKLAAPAASNMPAFFQHGHNLTNAINLSGGSETAQTYFSFADTRAAGIMPDNDLHRNNFKLRQTAKFFRKKLTLDASMNYITQHVNNTPSLGLYFNPLTGLYLFPRGENIAPYKAQYEFADSTGYARQNWIANEDIQQNPWWIVHRNPNYASRKRQLVSGNARYALSDRVSIQLRGNIDRVEDTYEQDLYSGTQATLAKPKGQFILNTQTLEQKYADALLAFKLPVPTSLEADGVVGASITDSKTVGSALGPGVGLITPNLFIAQNMATGGSVGYAATLPENHNQIQSVFAGLNATYRQWLSVNLTGRSDWSSNLSFTPDNSYFYPSAGISALLTEVFALPRIIDQVKVRGNYAQAGNTVPQYVTNPVNYIDNTGAVTLSTVAPFGTLKPERTKTYELGSDIKMLGSRLSITFNYYRSNTYNQFIRVVPSVATGYSAGYVNAGNVQNAGVELSIGLTAMERNQFEWYTSLNGASNNNRIIDVNSQNGIDKFVLTANDNTSYQSVLAKGGSYGDIYGVTARRDNQGRIVVNPDGTPQVNNGFHYIGNPNPKLTLGWSNSLLYKKFSLTFLVDGKFGGSVFSMTQAIMDQYGVSHETGQARDQGGVAINGVNESGEAVTLVDAQRWYTGTGGRQGISEFYVYSATVVRLREASLGYTAPISNTILKKLRLSLTGRNLLYFYKKAPYDPELIMSTGNGLSGVDIFNQPATRNIGFALQLTL